MIRQLVRITTWDEFEDYGELIFVYQCIYMQSLLANEPDNEFAYFLN